MSQRTPSHCPAIGSSTASIAVPEPAVPVVHLERVGPAREVRVPSVGQHARAGACLDADVVVRLAREVLLAARDVELGMLAGPRVVERGVVGHEVQHQPEPAAARAACGGARARAARRSRGARRNRVTANGEPHTSSAVKSGSSSRYSGCHSGRRRETCAPGRAGLPDAEQPDPVEPVVGDLVERGVGHVVERRRPTERHAELVEPRRAC